jgi:uncharacterized protein YyaL (SSP411 family)
MAFGGIHDQLAGGFHRYSTEPTWSIPHFEKMLYDNAQLLRLYAESYEATKQPLPIAETLKRAGFEDAAQMLASLAPERAKLLAARLQRQARDEKIVTGLNGLAISALARLHQLRG